MDQGVFFIFFLKSKPEDIGIDEVISHIRRNQLLLLEWKDLNLFTIHEVHGEWWKALRFLNDRTWKQLLNCCFCFFCLMSLHAVPIFDSQVYHMGKFSIYRTPGLPQGTRHFGYSSLFFDHGMACVYDKLWHLFSQCVSRLGALLPLGWWHSARPVVYGLVGRVSRTPDAQLPSCFQGHHAPTDHVSKWAIGQFRKQIFQHVQNVPKSVQLHTLDSQSLHAIWTKWYCMMTCGISCSVKSRRTKKVKYSCKMMRRV